MRGATIYNVCLRQLLNFLPCLTSSDAHLHKYRRFHFTAQLQLAHAVSTEYKLMVACVLGWPISIKSALRENIDYYVWVILPCTTCAINLRPLRHSVCTEVLLGNVSVLYLGFVYIWPEYT